SNIDCRVVAESLVRTINIVVDGFGHANDRHAALVQARSDTEGVVAADGHERGKIHALEVFDERIKLFIGWIGARRTEDCTAEVEDARHALAGERKIIALEHAGPTIAKTKYLVAFHEGLAGHP